MGVTGPAKAAGIQIGDRLLEIDGQPVLDFIDYNMLGAAASPQVALLRGESELSVTVKKADYQPMGLDLGDELYPKERVCRNKCRFCFVDQMPKGMRGSLYMKDDDWRYSVLYNNFITLTNLDQQDMARIIARHASPINVSVHCTDPELRAWVMGNPQATLIMDRLRELAAGGIALNCQAVLLPGVTDGMVLQRSMDDLYSLRPAVRSFAVVPVGLTGHRDGLYPLKPFTREEALDVVRRVEDFQEKARAQCGQCFVYAADEFYHLAGLPFPKYADGGYANQKGNGIGMACDFIQGAGDALMGLEQTTGQANVLLGTGVAASHMIGDIAGQVAQKVRGARAQVVEVKNHSFGETVTVAGLLCGADFARTFAGQPADGLIVPDAALRDGCFLDDMTLGQLSDALGMPVRSIPGDGYEFAEGLYHILKEGI